VSVAKASTAKATVGGRKVPVRTLEGGRAVAETIYVEDPAPHDGRALLIAYVTDGVTDETLLGPGGVAAAREHHRTAIAELDPGALRLGRGDPAIPTVFV
jgi:nicotinate phosphoribosyltransferase